MKTDYTSRSHSSGEKKFVSIHDFKVEPDKNGNDDKLFKASNIKTVNRKKEKHGYKTGEDSAVYEERKRAPGYVFTHHPGDADSEKTLKDLKSGVKGSNKRIVLQGRLGKDNPNAVKYQKASRKAGTYPTGGHPYQRIAKADAKHFDVYMYHKPEKYDEELDLIKLSIIEYYDERGEEISSDDVDVLSEELYHEIQEELNEGRDKRNSSKRDDEDEWENESKGRKLLKGRFKTARQRKMSQYDEETDLQELSKKTLGSYTKKAIDSMTSLTDASDRAYQRGSDKFYKLSARHLHKATNRHSGIDRAINRLTKEDLINSTIEKFIPEVNDYIPLTLEERLIESIESLSETYQGLIITLYESLSDDNKEALIDTLSNEDGINEAIDFALECNLQELSKATLKSYIKKATKSADKHWSKADSEEDKSMSTNGEKYPEKQKRHMDNASKHIDIANKRRSGLDRAKGNLFAGAHQ